MQAHFLYCDHLTSLAPLLDLRPSFNLRTGALTTRERYAYALGGPALGTFDASSAPQALPEAAHADVILINARIPLPPASLLKLTPGAALVNEADGQPLAARITLPTPSTLAATIASLVAGTFQPTATIPLPASEVLTRPWHLRALRDRCMLADLTHLTSLIPSRAAHPGAFIITKDDGPRLHAHPTATIFPATIFDCEKGTIVLDEASIIRPGAQLIGPCYVGPGSTILERATIRPFTAIGPSCKVNGEVGGTIFQGFSNKAHDGYLGDSYLGEWVNLGAGTTTSNLLNTYGEIITRQAPGSPNERTGQTFLGSVIGDHTKTAICTRLMTGTIIHTGSMIASTAAASGCIPPFSWITDAGTRSYRFDKFVDVLRASMLRRGVSPTDDLLLRLRRLHDAAIANRPTL